MCQALFCSKSIKYVASFEYYNNPMSYILLLLYFTGRIEAYRG